MPLGLCKKHFAVTETPKRLSWPRAQATNTLNQLMPKNTGAATANNANRHRYKHHRGWLQYLLLGRHSKSSSASTKPPKRKRLEEERQRRREERTERGQREEEREREREIERKREEDRREARERERQSERREREGRGTEEMEGERGRKRERDREREGDNERERGTTIRQIFECTSESVSKFSKIHIRQTNMNNMLVYL